MKKRINRVFANHLEAVIIHEFGGNTPEIRDEVGLRAGCSGEYIRRLIDAEIPPNESSKCYRLAEALDVTSDPKKIREWNDAILETRKSEGLVKPRVLAVGAMQYRVPPPWVHK